MDKPQLIVYIRTYKGVVLMSVIRVNKTQNYTVLSNYHFKEKGLSLKAKGLLSLMLSLPDDWNYSVSGLVKLSKDGKDSVMSALGELEEFGYLVRVRTTNSKGQFSGIEYNIYEMPQREKPSVDNPILAAPTLADPTEENPAQLNTKELNTKNNKILNKQNTNKEMDINNFEDILLNVVNVDIRNLYVDYIEMRRVLGAPITKRGLKMLIDRCERISNFNIRVQKLLLETAIINNWKNVYLPSETEVKGANKEVLDELKSFYGGE
jgi:hypothetical protein